MVVRVVPGLEIRDRRRRPYVPRPQAVRLPARVHRGALGRWDREASRFERSPVGKLLRWLYCGYQEVNAGDLAAALAYHSLVALVPTFLGLVSIAGLFLQRDDVLEMAIYASVWALPLDDARSTLEALLEARQNSGWFGIVSLLGFAWVGLGFVNAMARGINRVYGVPNRHFFHQRLRSFVLMVVFAVLFLVAAFAAALPSLFIARDLNFYFETWHLATGEGQVLSYLIGFAAAGLMFLIIYRMLPNAGQFMADVWPGTLVAATAFVALAQAFPLYIRLFAQTNRYAVVFGAGTLLVLWFYFLAHVLLFGAYVNATHQRRRRRAAQRRRLAGHSLRMAEPTATGEAGFS
jgi:membrane protein